MHQILEKTDNLLIIHVTFSQFTHLNLYESINTILIMITEMIPHSKRTHKPKRTPTRIP